MLRSMSQRAGISSPDVLCSLFAAIILPVIEYGSEIWGTKQYMQLERFFLKFLKEILGQPYNATNNTIYGDTGSFPCWIRTYTRVVNYFRRITDSQAPPLVVNAFEVSKQNQGRRSWWSQLESILFAFNLVPAGSLLSRSDCSAKLQESFIQDWLNQLWSDSHSSGGNKLRCYHLFKTTLGWECYLSWVTVREHRITLARLRTNCHSLEIKVGRHHKPPIPENEKICRFCSTSSIDNETHFLLECPTTDSLRSLMLFSVESIYQDFQSLSGVEKTKLILSSVNRNIVYETAHYIYMAFELRKILSRRT